MWEFVLGALGVCFFGLGCFGVWGKKFFVINWIVLALTGILIIVMINSGTYDPPSHCDVYPSDCAH